MNLFRRRAVETAKDAMNVVGSAAVDKSAQSLAQLFRSWWAGEEPFEHGAKVEARTADKYRQMSPHYNLFEHLPRLARILAGRPRAGRRDALEQMMRDARPFRSRR